MLVLMLEACARQGFECRSDILMHLNNAAASPLAGLDAFSISRLAKRIDDIAVSLLTHLSPDDPRDGLYCTAMFCLKLVDEGLLEDKQNQAVLVSLMLIDDVKDDQKDVNGAESVWRVDEARWKASAGNMLHRAHLQGLYLRTIKMCN
ncbi:hypothetical protein [Hyphomicrobium sp. ghe19]|uniref:hypothetical protein n=1 Tax=Hyphomicrobium sp. ghe19 TaxID=2682968 RepID=UPI0030CDCE24